MALMPQNDDKTMVFQPEDKLSTPSLTSPRGANEFIEKQLDDRLEKIENEFHADALCFNGPLLLGVDDILRNFVEKKHGQEPRRTNLVVLLTTEGGYIEPVQRAVDLLRRHYSSIDFVIPNYAYSAGTIFALSGDAIHMDYYSRLGPIDPQTENPNKRMVPALGYLEKYDELMEKAAAGTINLVEIQILLKFDQAELHKYEQERELSITLLKDWLVKYKFKNWEKTETRGLDVTDAMRTERAEFIATELNKTKKWHTHGYGISKDVLTNDLKLLIDDFGANPIRSGIIRDYHDLMADYMLRRAAIGVIHVSGDYAQFV